MFVCIILLTGVGVSVGASNGTAGRWARALGDVFQPSEAAWASMQHWFNRAAVVREAADEAADEAEGEASTGEGVQGRGTLGLRRSPLACTMCCSLSTRSGATPHCTMLQARHHGFS